MIWLDDRCRLLKKGIRTSHVIHNQKGKFYRPAAYSAAVKLAGNKAGIVSLGPHSLGHSSMVTTLQVYSHVLDTMQDEAAEKAGGVVSIPAFLSHLIVREGTK